MTKQKNELDDIPVLYILMRTDLESMNAGKGMAQACHAANQCVKTIRDCSDFNIKLNDMLTQWEQQSNKGFGTTIVLDGGTENNIQMTVEALQNKNSKVKFCDHDIIAGMTFDPSYPLKDGNTLHIIPLYTCAFVFSNKNNKNVRFLLDKMSLHC